MCGPKTNNAMPPELMTEQETREQYADALSAMAERLRNNSFESADVMAMVPTLAWVSGQVWAKCYGEGSR